MADKTRTHENAADVVQDMPYCRGKVLKGKRAGMACRKQSTLLGDEKGLPACEKHGGRTSPDAARVERKGSVSHLSVMAGGRDIMGHGTAGAGSSRWTQLCNGEISVQELDTEELARQQVKDATGQFRGKPSAMVPRALAREMSTELFRRANEKFEESLVECAEMIGGIARDPAVEPQVRLKAAQYLIERVMGKVPDKVETSGEKRYESLMTKVLRQRPSELRDAAAATDDAEEAGDAG